MIRAYDKVYLDKARTALGSMLDFAVYDLKYDIAEFFNLFIKSGVARRFETGDFAVIVGMSGVELAYEAVSYTHLDVYKRQTVYCSTRRSFNTCNTFFVFLVSFNTKNRTTPCCIRPPPVRQPKSASSLFFRCFRSRFSICRSNSPPHMWVTGSAKAMPAPGSASAPFTYARILSTCSSRSMTEKIVLLLSLIHI